MTRTCIAAVWLWVAACELPSKSLGVAAHDDDTQSAGGDAVACDEAPPVFPTFLKSCGEDADCRRVLHRVDCCGSQAALGVAVDEVDAFAEAEAMCVADVGACRCLAQPTTAEQGGASDDEANIRVACIDDECRTYVAP